MCKLYLSAILNLYDWRIVSYVLSERNDNLQGFKTFDKAAQANPDADSLFSTRQRIPVHQPRISPQARAGGDDAEYVPCGALH